MIHGTLRAGAFLLLLLAPAYSQRESARPGRAPLDLAPLSSPTPRSAEIVPVLAGGRVLVSSSLRVHALDAATGELAWSSGLPAGWDQLDPAARHELWAGIDRDGLWGAPAASSRVVVATLQVPVSRGSGEEWHGLRVDPAFPERRLFAFDLESGRALWNHAPPPDWDRQSGPLPQRMNVCAPPLVAGERVLVPCTSDRSSIDFQVACYALDTGALLWTTFVLRGQIERDSFGNLGVEFVSAPLVASPDGTRVLVQTELGRVAALAYHDGAELWSTPYDPAPLPKARSYSAPPRRRTWRTTPPLIADGTVWATPRDGTGLLVLDLASGALLASVSAAELQALAPAEARLELDYLAGVAGERVFLGGKGVAAFERLRSPGQPDAWRLCWTRPADRTSVRARLQGGQLLVPGTMGLAVLDLLTGAELSRRPLGNLLGLTATDSTLIGFQREGLVTSAR